MKSNLTILIIFVVLLLIIAGLTWQLTATKKELHNKETVINEKTDSLRELISKSGEKIYVKATAVVDPKDFDKYYKELSQKLSKDMDVKIKNLKAVFDARLLAQGFGQVIGKDTVVIKSGVQTHETQFLINDNYLNFNGTLDTANRLTYNYNYSDELTFAIAGKKKWFLGNEKLYGTGHLKNPNAKITNQTSVIVEKYRDKRFYVGAGISYDPFVNQVRPTLQVGWALFKF